VGTLLVFKVLEGAGSDKHTSLPQLGFDIEVLEATGDNLIRPVLAKFMKIPQIFLNITLGT
jgi:hypothetical protein